MSINIQPGHIARHTPPNAGAQGQEAAIIDIAQDLLLRYLDEEGILQAVALKGGTSIRKLYAGNEGRFSLDLDFATVDINGNQNDAISEIIAAVDGLSIENFGYGITERCGKWSLTFNHPQSIGDFTLQSKLDFSPPPWLEPIKKSWSPLPIHAQYGDPPLPELNVVRIEENIAEKIARLNRATPARDMYDLRWLMLNPAKVGVLDKALIRRLTVLKIWVDANGVHGGDSYWKPGHEGLPFDPEHWLRQRTEKDFDIEDIGALAVPTPTAKELSDAARAHYDFLLELDQDEQVIAQTNERDRSLAISMLEDLPYHRLKGIGLY
jgi:predicted nucleotidyltransferase component of viral defense system